MIEELEFASRFAQKYKIEEKFLGIPFSQIPGGLLGELRRLRTRLKDSGYPPTEENLYRLMKVHKLLYSEVLSSQRSEFTEKLQQIIADIKPVAGVPSLDFIWVFFGVSFILISFLRQAGVLAYIKERLAQRASEKRRHPHETITIILDEENEPIRRLSLEYWKDTFDDNTQLEKQVTKLLKKLTKKEE